MYGRCPPPVLFRQEKDRTQYKQYTSVQTGSGQPLADWYSVLVTFNDYIVSLEEPSQTLVDSASDNATMQTLKHVMGAVKGEFITTVSKTYS